MFVGYVPTRTKFHLLTRFIETEVTNEHFHELFRNAQNLHGEARVEAIDDTLLRVRKWRLFRASMIFGSTIAIIIENEVRIVTGS